MPQRLHRLLCTFASIVSAAAMAPSFAEAHDMSAMKNSQPAADSKMTPADGSEKNLPTDSPSSPSDSSGAPFGPMMSSVKSPTSPADCGEMEVWDFSVAMCLPRAMPGMSMQMLMLHGNGFLTQTVEEGPRGTNALTLPNMFMIDAGTTIGSFQYVNLEWMGTIERWVYPPTGYPEFLQIGEEDARGRPFVDHQHPHSSPVMGLTLSDTISFGEKKDHLKLFFGPRSQSTDGPVAFMHRATGMVNPDAPLGHHIGQDAGHIASTVAGAALRFGSHTVELSTFHGAEPSPESVDLPMGAMNSYAARWTEEFTPQVYAMASAAFVRSPESGEPDLGHVWRYSASIYTENILGHSTGRNHRESTLDNVNNGSLAAPGATAHDWKINNTFIFGLINGYDHTASLSSFAEEFLIQTRAESFWGRIECLQRTATELEVGLPDANRPHWVEALTLGYTHKLIQWSSADLGMGGSVTRDFLPIEYRAAYGGEPLTAKLFLQLGGMNMVGL